MAYLSLKDINKIYPNGFHAVHNFNLEIEQGEFIIFVGPSGCGKSTTLRMIAGLEDISKGEFHIDGKYANEMRPRERGVAMVFQSYALYPHLSVYDNLAFGLSLQGIDDEIIEEKVLATAKILGLTDYLDRKPRALSGGQRQRVAVGRAIIRKVGIFLMDEPLSNLDAKQRVTMRSEITDIHRKVGSTTIYVTHDRQEALSMADRMAVLKDGVIRQCGTPRELYDRPADRFTGTFLGDMNIIDGVIDNDSLQTVFGRFPLTGDCRKARAGAIRPERIRFVDAGHPAAFPATVTGGTFLGDCSEWRCNANGAILTVRECAPPVRENGETVYLAFDSNFLLAVE